MAFSNLGLTLLKLSFWLFFGLIVYGISYSSHKSSFLWVGLLMWLKVSITKLSGLKGAFMHPVSACVFLMRFCHAFSALRCDFLLLTLILLNQGK